MRISLVNAVGDLFKTPQKWRTILFLALCLVIPMVGPLLMIGYFFQRFSRARNGLGEPDFTFDLFTEYLLIGLWAFLASLMALLVFMPLYFASNIPIFIGITMEEKSPEISISLMVLGGLLMLIIYSLLWVVAFPMMLLAGLKMDFKAAFSWKFIKSFVRKVGLSLFGWFLLLLILVIPASCIGILALYVGYHLVMITYMFATFHILFQHYDLFLERGGEEIEIHPRVLGSPATLNHNE